MTSRFLQIHSLTSYPGVLLNRDDVGMAKRLPFGGAIRTRISSQCLKRHWRQHAGEWSLAATGEPMSIRSRRTFDKFVLQPLVNDGVDPQLARAATEAMMAEVLGLKPEKQKANKNEKSNGDDAVQTAQVTVLGPPELEFLRKLARQICADTANTGELRKLCKNVFDRDARANLAALRRAAGLDAAMFGRMVTSDILARGDAALHVAHAFTVHAEEAETDYFTAVDDLLRDGEDEDDELGSGHIGTTELTSGLFYGYVVVDVPLLIANLEGCRARDWVDADRSLAADLTQRMVHLIATVSPGAKLGSTAPHGRAQLVLVESGSSQPRSLANAFLKPVPTREDMLQISYSALATHLVDLDQMYGREFARAHAACGPHEVFGDLAGERVSMADLAAWAAEQVRDQ